MLPMFKNRARMSETVEDFFIKELAANLAVAPQAGEFNFSTKPFGCGFPSAILGQEIPVSLCHSRIARLVNSYP
tara:strand:+ start:5456 stop:5677 length:222 start_codon:yes stop_codon:yes gene_type:complete